MVLLRCKLPPESRLVSRTYLLYCLLVIGIRFLHWYQSQHEFFEICFENIVGLCLGCLLWFFGIRLSVSNVVFGSSPSGVEIWKLEFRNSDKRFEISDLENVTCQNFVAKFHREGRQIDENPIEKYWVWIHRWICSSDKNGDVARSDSSTRATQIATHGGENFLVKLTKRGPIITRHVSQTMPC